MVEDTAQRDAVHVRHTARHSTARHRTARHSVPCSPGFQLVHHSTPQHTPARRTTAWRSPAQPSPAPVREHAVLCPQLAQLVEEGGVGVGQHARHLLQLVPAGGRRRAGLVWAGSAGRECPSLLAPWVRRGSSWGSASEASPPARIPGARHKAPAPLHRPPAHLMPVSSWRKLRRAPRMRRSKQANARASSSNSCTNTEARSDLQQDEGGRSGDGRAHPLCAGSTQHTAPPCQCCRQAAAGSVASCCPIRSTTKRTPCHSTHSEHQGSPARPCSHALAVACFGVVHRVGGQQVHQPQHLQQQRGAARAGGWCAHRQRQRQARAQAGGGP